MTPPILCIVGKSGSGKTTFLEKLIPELLSRGYRPAVVKHDVHGFEIDHPGKDTWRLRRAGAWRVAISSPERIAIIGRVEEEMPLAELARRYLGDVDIVLTEGYKRSPWPKVEVCRAERSRELICTPEELVAIVSDLRFDLPCPQFDLDDVAGLADLLEAHFLTPAAPEQVRLRLQVDGREVPLKPFLQEMLAGAIRGFLAGLKGSAGRQIALEIEEPE